MNVGVKIAIVLFWIALTLDLLLYLGLLPGGTISVGIRELAAKHPIAWRACYFAIAVFLYYHLFMVAS